MKAFAFFSSSSKKKESKSSPIAPSFSLPLPAPDASPSLLRKGSVDSKTLRQSSTLGKHAFMRSVTRLDEPRCLPDAPLPSSPPREPRRSFVFRRPRFGVCGADLSEEGGKRPSRPRRTLSLGAQAEPTPDFRQAIASCAIALPPVPSLPRDLLPTAQSQGDSAPSTPLPSVDALPPLPPIPKSLRMESPRSPRNAGAPRRRAKSCADKESTVRSKKSMPEMEGVWRDFLREAQDDVVPPMPPMPRLHSYHGSPRVKTRTKGPPVHLPLTPPPPLKLPELPVVAADPSGPPAPYGNQDTDCTNSTRGMLNTPASPPRRVITDLFHSLSPNPGSCSATLPHIHSPPTSSQLDRQVSCASSEISSEVSLSLFPLPPAPPNSPRAEDGAKKSFREENPVDKILGSPLSTPPSSPRSSDADSESPRSPVDDKFPPLLRLVQTKGHWSRGSGCLVTTEEWAEHSVPLSPLIEGPEPCSPWRDTHFKPRRALGKGVAERHQGHSDCVEVIVPSDV